MFSSEHAKETQILLTAFKQYGYNIKCFKPNYNNYIKIIQFTPTLLLMEIPLNCNEQIKFISLIKSHPKIKTLPILGYGQELRQNDSKSLKKVGITEYFERPLRFSEILKKIEILLPEKIKELKKNENAIAEENDISVFFNPEIASQRKLEIITHHASSFLAFPFVVARALAVSNDPKSGARDLANTIMSDPVISSQILKMSNTVFYAGSSERISSIKDAIIRIGFNETRRLVLCVGVMEIFERKDRTYGFNRKKFWLHSISVAVITEFIFSRSKFKSFTEFGFLCGLLHDFGTITLDEFIPDLFTEIVEDTIDKGALFSDEFKKRVGFLPQDIAQEFFTQWKLPQPIISSCNYKKKDPLNLSSKSLEEYLVLALEAANNIAKSLSLGLSCDQTIIPITNNTAEKLMLTTGISEMMLDKIHHNIYSIIQFLNIKESSISGIKKINDECDDNDIAFFELDKQLIPVHFLHMKSEELKIKNLVDVDELIEFCKIGKLIIISNLKGDENFSRVLELCEKLKGEKISVLLLSNDSKIFEDKIDFDGLEIMDINFDMRLIEQKINECLLEVKNH